MYNGPSMLGVNGLSPNPRACGNPGTNRTCLWASRRRWHKHLVILVRFSILAGTVMDYEEWKFSQYALAVIRKHSTGDEEHPLFLNYNMHVVHMPLQAPHSYFEAQAVRTNATFPDAPNQPRAIYHAMVKFADDGTKPAERPRLARPLSLLGSQGICPSILIES